MKEIDIQVGDKEFRVKIAGTALEKEEGLSKVKKLPKYAGMLFIEDDDEAWFTMKDTSIPLDIIFINEDFIVTAVHSVEAFSKEPIKNTDDDLEFVLEVNINSGIKEGDLLSSDEDLEAISEEYDDLDDYSEAKKTINNKMLVLDENGDVQMKLEGGERIFSRISTRKIIKQAIKAYRKEKAEDFIKLGKIVFKELDALDNREPLYVDSPKKHAFGSSIEPLDSEMKVLYKGVLTSTSTELNPANFNFDSEEDFSNNSNPYKKLSIKEGNAWDTFLNAIESNLNTESLSLTNSTSANAAVSTLSNNSELSEITDNVAKEAIEYLKTKYNYSDLAANAIVRTFKKESGLKPGNTNLEEEKLYGNKAGKGIGQWSNSRRKDYDEWMKDKQGTLQDELDYFALDALKRPAFLKAINAATNITEAVDAFVRGYENGSANNLASVEQMNSTYKPAWKRLGYKKDYDYNTILNETVKQIL